MQKISIFPDKMRFFLSFCVCVCAFRKKTREKSFAQDGFYKININLSFKSLHFSFLIFCIKKLNFSILKKSKNYYFSLICFLLNFLCFFFFWFKVFCLIIFLFVVQLIIVNQMKSKVYLCFYIYLDVSQMS